MKVFKLALFLLSVLLLPSCLDTMTEQDHAFVGKIKTHLKKKGDVVKVSDIHPGDWTKVCFTLNVESGTGEAIEEVASFFKLDKKEVKVLNRRKSATAYVDDWGEWGIYFFYPPYSIEYFSISDAELDKGGRGVSNARNALDNCVKKSNAYFQSNYNMKIKRDGRQYFHIKLIQVYKENEK